MEDYKPIIGLEIHVELKTKSKMFCQCPADYFGKKPNSHVCPVCLGLPGALPVPNKKAVEWTILMAKALNCKINTVSKFDRKHYFYPDLPKGYQISQYDEPIATDGMIVIASEQSERSNPNEIASSPTASRNDIRKIRITRVHLEEDTGKLLHIGADTLVDFNRSGVPLVEIVTEPDFDNAYDVKRFLEELQVIIRYLGVSDADMEKGSMRLEPNISVSSQLSVIGNQSRTEKPTNRLLNADYRLPNYKVEVKNINSFRFVKEAIEYEVERQIGLLEKEKIPQQETRGYDEKKGVTYSQRSKEEAHDYRYFPEPDIPPMTFSKKYVEEIEKQLPELPHNRMQRYVKDFKLRQSDAFALTRNLRLAEYFEGVNEKFKIQNTKLQFKIQNYEQSIANFIINKKISITLTIDQFVKKAFEMLTPKKMDEKLLDTTINRLIVVNKKAVGDYKKGKENAIMFLVGQVMREMKGKADAKIVKNKLLSKLK